MLGVLAEIVVFALSPRFTLAIGRLLVVIGAASAVARWSITAQDPPMAVLAVVQLGHGLTFGLTLVGTMGLLVRQVPAPRDGAGAGLSRRLRRHRRRHASILSGMVYARYGQGVYHMMAAMAAGGADWVMWLARDRFTRHPHNTASGG